MQTSNLGRDSLRLTYATYTHSTGTHNACTSLKGLRYHAGAGKQFTGLFAIPLVRIPLWHMKYNKKNTSLKGSCLFCYGVP